VSDVFLSYANEDREAARRIAAALEARGWSTFWDRVIPAGKTWREVIGTELDGARCVIVLWSRASIASKWVQEEADHGLRRNLLIPALIENVHPPIGFRSIQAADLSDFAGDGGSPAFESFIGDIASLVGAPAPAAEAGPAADEPPRTARAAWPARPAVWMAAAGAVALIAVGIATAYLIPDRDVRSAAVEPQAGGGAASSAARVGEKTRGLLDTGLSGLSREISPSFDCGKAATLQEWLICSDADLARADLEMGMTYERLREKLALTWQRAKLQDAQRTWVEARDAACPVATADLQFDESRRASLACLIDQTRARTQELGQILESVKN